MLLFVPQSLERQKEKVIAIAYAIIERDVQTGEVSKAYNELVEYMGKAVYTDYSAFKLAAKKAAKETGGKSVNNS